MISIIFDCGATNVRAVAIDDKGIILRSKSYPNNTQPDPFYPNYRIWDIASIWDKMCMASREIIAGLPGKDIIGITVTTFGVDGTLFDKKGTILYPMISWQCDRTRSIMESIRRYISPDELYHESALLPFSFNTIYKIIWLKENRPGLINKAYKFLFAPSIFLYLLTGKMVNDITMAGTSMMTSASRREFSGKILDSISFPEELFGKLVEPGSIIGSINRSASRETGLQIGVPVIATGHDTQFAIFGSGAEINQPVLSSGTWEILMNRSSSYKSGEDQLNDSITTEFDPTPGHFNIGNQWMASGVIEWVRRTYFNDLIAEQYEIMSREAENVAQEYPELVIDPCFFDRGISDASDLISEFPKGIARGIIYRKILEALSQRLVLGKKVLEKAGGTSIENIICVGGGSKNSHWNQLRANATGVPLKIIDQKETTVLGASFFVQLALGLVSSPGQAREKVNYNPELIYPE